MTGENALKKSLVIIATIVSCVACVHGAKRGEAADAYPDLEEVIVVYKTHLDIGYSALARDVIHEYHTEMVDRVLDAIEQSRHQTGHQIRP